ncbi:hypothetical protein BC739_000909 [Kutzneria viridogrisea]|uniref:Uncharacterized protein n=1 Tax=Kutzneria viridogrisea TaxID=47990 RepID=A0ABR6BA49_9PSEU|nr:hypothetical protein [Kutzneria viridogrisea]
MTQNPRQVFTFKPDYRIFTLRDVECDAGVGRSEAVREANRNASACTDYEVYVACAQDLFDVSVTIETLPGEPEPGDCDFEWSRGIDYELTCPSGELRLGDPTTYGFTVALPDGSGVYAIRVRHAGREQADQARNDALANWQGTSSAAPPTSANGDAIERYLLQLWHRSPIADDDSD